MNYIKIFFEKSIAKDESCTEKEWIDKLYLFLFNMFV